MSRQAGDYRWLRGGREVVAATTFEVRITDVEVLRAWLVELVVHVSRRLRRHEINARAVE